MKLFTNIFGICCASFAFLVLFLKTAGVANAQEYPRATLSDVHFVGAFRLPANNFGLSNLNNAQGAIEYNAKRNSLYIVGNSNDQAIAEFAIPRIVNSSSLLNLNMAGNPLQTFTGIFNRINGGNPQALDRIGGLRLFETSKGLELMFSAYQYNDSDGNVTQTTGVIRNADNLTSSSIDGFYTLQGGAGRTAGWIAPVPDIWQGLFGGSFLAGTSSGLPNFNRSSLGPTAFGFNPSDLIGTISVPNPIQTVELLNFTAAHPLALNPADLLNIYGKNNLWTYLSRAVYGMIIPGTRTYFTIGYSGGHSSGVCYQCFNDMGSRYPGYGSKKAADNYAYYWLWDLDDLAKVKSGERLSWNVLPYEYGIFPAPFGKVQFGGGTFDNASGRLYLSELGADTAQGPYANPPVIDVFEFSAFTPFPTPTPFGGIPTATSTPTVTPTVPPGGTAVPTATPTRNVTAVPSSTPTPRVRGKKVDPIVLTPEPTPSTSTTPESRNQKYDRLTLLLGDSQRESESPQLISITGDGEVTQDLAIRGKAFIASSSRTGTVSLQQGVWQWYFQDNSGHIVRQQFGEKGEIPLLGCQFSGAVNTALFDSVRKEIKYSTVNGKIISKVALGEITMNQQVKALFCGDVNGDRKDELAISLTGNSGGASSRTLIVYNLVTQKVLTEVSIPRKARPFFTSMGTKKATLGWLTPGAASSTISFSVDGNTSTSPPIPSLAVKEFVVGRFDLPAKKNNPLLIGVSSSDRSLIAVDLSTQETFPVLTAAEFLGKSLLQSGNIARLGIK